MAEAGTLHDAFIDELRDAYDAEKQLTKALPKLAKAASSPELRDAFESHLEETRGQIERLEQVFASLDEKVRGKHCDGIAGIIEEGKSVMEEDFDEATMDACLIAAGQRAEHYEMAAYGTLVAWARAMGHDGGGRPPAADPRRREGGRREAVGARRRRHQPERRGSGAPGRGRRHITNARPRVRRRLAGARKRPGGADVGWPLPLVAPHGTERELPAAGTALLLIDVVNDLAFPGSDVLVEQAEPMSKRLAAFKKRAAKAGVPTIYVNDNFGQWRSDFRRTVAHCSSRARPDESCPAAQADDAGLLRPEAETLGILRHDARHAARDLAIARVIVTGIAGNICVLFTANDAYMRGLSIYAPADCIVSNTDDDNAHALRQIEVVLEGRTARRPG